MKLTPELKHKIDNMPLPELLRKCRFAPAGDPLFQCESGEYFRNVMQAKRAADPEGWTIASKQTGW